MTYLIERVIHIYIFFSAAAGKPVVQKRLSLMKQCLTVTSMLILDMSFHLKKNFTLNVTVAIRKNI